MQLVSVFFVRLCSVQFCYTLFFLLHFTLHFIRHVVMVSPLPFWLKVR